MPSEASASNELSRRAARRQIAAQRFLQTRIVRLQTRTRIAPRPERPLSFPSGKRTEFFKSFSRLGSSLDGPNGAPGGVDPNAR